MTPVLGLVVFAEVVAGEFVLALVAGAPSFLLPLRAK
jgi:hypothetical protein